MVVGRQTLGTAERLLLDASCLMKGLEPCCAVVVCDWTDGIFRYGWTTFWHCLSKNLAGDKLNPKADIRRLDSQAPRAQM
jgi:hypothetical protein